MAEQMVREAVGVFDDGASLQAAVDELMVNGVDRSFLSLMAAGETIERELGHRYRRVEEMADNPDAPHVAFVGVDSPVTGKGAAVAALAYIGACAAAGAVVASGGAMAVAAAAALAAGVGGGATGALLARFVGGYHARRLQEQLERGGILLWVRTPDDKSEGLACDILARNGAGHVHGHSLPAPDGAGASRGVSDDLALVDKPIGAWFRRARNVAARWSA